MKWKEQIEKYLEPLMNTKLLAIILLVGIVFLILPGFFGEKEESLPAKNIAIDSRAYVKELEQRLSDILSTIQGAGKISVMITLDDEGETVYAQDVSSDRKPIANAEANGESRADEKKLVLKSDAGGGQSPISVVKTMPKVSGVLVTAQGADDERVKSDLIQAIKSVLDVKTHRVAVLVKK
ncbi:MAG: hypothetical protein IJA08_07525 [Clostridia bacterium]|nr:hypothetical protein [Clostridia bacterium]